MTQNTYQVLGDEELNEDALNAILASAPRSHWILACSGFDFETKVIAVTNQSVIICNTLKEKPNWPASITNISSVSNDGRTLVIDTVDQVSHRYRMGKAEVVEELVGIIRRQKAASRYSGETGSDGDFGDTDGGDGYRG